MTKFILLTSLFGCSLTNASELVPPREIPPALECSQVLRDLVRVRNFVHLEPDELAREPYFKSLSFLKEENILYGHEYDLIQMMTAMHLHEAAFRFVRSLELYREHRTPSEGKDSRDSRRNSRKLIEIGQALTQSLASRIKAPDAILSLLSFFSAVLEDSLLVNCSRFMAYLNDLLLDPRTLDANALAIINELNVRKVLLHKFRDFEPELTGNQIKQLLDKMSPLPTGI